MDFKAMLFLLASFLLVTTMVSATDEEFNVEAIFAKDHVEAPAQLPVKEPLPAIDPIIIPPPAKAPVIVPTPPAKAPVISLPPPQVPVKAPPPAPVVKPPTIAPRPPIRTTADCTAQCGERCNLHSRKNLCMRACGTCCGRCKCVPPGTYGNREMCGICYTGMTTHGNKPKCP